MNYNNPIKITRYKIIINYKMNGEILAIMFHLFGGFKTRKNINLSYIAYVLKIKRWCFSFALIIRLLNIKKFSAGYSKGTKIKKSSFMKTDTTIFYYNLTNLPYNMRSRYQCYKIQKKFKFDVECQKVPVRESKRYWPPPPKHII